MKRITLVQRRNGAATTEYAVMMALVASVVIVGAVLIADATQNALGGMDWQASASPPLDRSLESHRRALQLAAKPGIDQFEHGLSPVMALLVASSLAVMTLMYSQVRGFSRRTTSSPELRDVLPEVPEADLFGKRQEMWKLLSVDTRNLLENHMTVRHLMTTEVQTVTPSAPMAKVCSLMAAQRFRHILVCKEDRLVGIISDRDVRGRHGASAVDVMTHTPITIGPDAQVFQAITLIIKKMISCLPVVEDGRLVGVVTTTDLLMALQCSTRLLQQMADGQLQVNGANRGRRISDLVATEQPAAPAKPAE